MLMFNVLLLYNLNLPLNILMLVAFILGTACRGWSGIYLVSIGEMVKEE